MTAIEELRERGHVRQGTPRTGFRWRTAAGRPVSRADAGRLDALRLPPAWKDVHASPSPGAKVQAIGRDAAGRWQYRYHPDFTRRREEAKYRRLLRFAEALPRLRRAIDRDLARHGLSRERVLACGVRILMTCFMRAGSEKHMRQNGSFGVATLRAKHVRVTGSLVRFDFPGKSGRRHVRELRDPRVARVVKQLLAVPGRDLLKFEADDGWVDVRRRHLNAYVREVTGGPFTSKDFRTWAGTLVCACELARRAPEAIPGRTSAKRTVSAAVKATAEVLGNTPAVCRSAYINPGVLDAFERGRVLARYVDAVGELASHLGGLHGTERALLDLLASPVRLAPKPPARRDRAPRTGAPAGKAPRPTRGATMAAGGAP